MKEDIKGRGRSWCSIADSLKSADSGAGFMHLPAAYEMPHRMEFEEVCMPYVSKKMYESFADNSAIGCGDNANKGVVSAGGRSLNDTEEGAGKRC